MAIKVGKKNAESEEEVEIISGGKEAAPEVKIEEETEQAPPKRTPKPNTPTVTLKSQEQQETVRITMLESIEPPPKIGNWDGHFELGITKMAEKATYSVPRHVACRIVDAKKGVISG